LPVAKREIEVLFELAMNRYGEDVFRAVARRHNWEPIIRKKKAGGQAQMIKLTRKSKKIKDWDKTIRSVVSMTDEQKFRLIIEIMLEVTGTATRLLN